MSKFIKTNLGLIFFILFPNLVLACGIKNNYNLYLFSGAVASTAFRLDLYQDPKLKGILSYYEFAPTTASKFAGGIYLSQKLIEEIPPAAIIFIEESKELKETFTVVNLRLHKNWNLINFEASSQSPYEVSLKALNLLQNYLDSSCVSKIKSLKRNMEDYFSIIKKSKMRLKTVVFFSGQWKGIFPENSAIVLNNQGFINELAKNNIVVKKEINEEIKFSSWSAQEFGNPKTLFIGIDSVLKEKDITNQMTRIDNNKFEIQCFACLIPGLLQLQWLSDFVLQKFN